MMSRWVEFGSHTRVHPILTTCDERECWNEIVDSKRELEEVAETECHHFSYPNGDYTSREEAIVEQAGYDSARTMDIGRNILKTDPLRLRVLGTHDDALLNRLVGDLSGVVPFFSRVFEGAFTGRKPPITLRPVVDRDERTKWSPRPNQ